MKIWADSPTRLLWRPVRRLAHQARLRLWEEENLLTALPKQETKGPQRHLGMRGGWRPSACRPREYFSTFLIGYFYFIELKTTFNGSSHWIELKKQQIMSQIIDLLNNFINIFFVERCFEVGFVFVASISWFLPHLSRTDFLYSFPDWRLQRTASDQALTTFIHHSISTRKKKSLN